MASAIHRFPRRPGLHAAVRLPGVKPVQRSGGGADCSSPDHPIFQAIIRGEYSEGLALYQTLGQPSPEDDRWAGYCLYSLGQHYPAKDLLLRARARGCAAAALELGTVLRSLGDAQAARAEIESIPLPRLGALDRAYALRELAALRLNDGQQREALDALERAWNLLDGLQRGSESLRAQTAQLLGYTNHQLGHSAAAMHYLGVSLEHIQGVKRLQPLMTRAQVHLYSGRYAEAQQDLDAAAELLPSAPGAVAYHAYLTGLLMRAQGRWTDALDPFCRAVEAARTTGESGTEFLGELGVATVYTAQGQYREARPHLVRASRLHTTQWERALMNLREGHWRGASGQAGAAERLERARLAFAEMDLPREQAWAELHLAELLADRDEPGALAALRRAVEYRYALDSGAALLPELHMLPGLRALLARQAHDPDVLQLLGDRASALGDCPLQVRLITLGGARLEADGREIRLGMRRTVEVLAFLLARTAAGRDEILAALWPDDEPRRSRNYFHQVVFALKETAPYLRVEYDRRSRLYRLACDGPLFSWDAGDTKRALSAEDENERQRAVQEFPGPFLPEADTDWAREERDALTFSVIEVGLKLMARWSAQGEYSKCASLSRRLLEVDPCDEVLVEYLVEATLELEGRVAAQRVLLDAGTRAERELQAAPDWLGRLAVRVQAPTPPQMN